MIRWYGISVVKRRDIVARTEMPQRIARVSSELGFDSFDLIGSVRPISVLSQASG